MSRMLKDASLKFLTPCKFSIHKILKRKNKNNILKNFHENLKKWNQRHDI